MKQYYFQIKMSLSKKATLKKNPRINLGKLLELIPNIENQVNFLQELDILPKHKICEKCTRVQDRLEFSKNYVFFRCHVCKTKQSVRGGTILSKSHLSLRRFILVCYTFVQFTWTYSQGNCTLYGISV